MSLRLFRCLWLVAAILAAHNTIRGAEIVNFTGGDPGEGLDFEGDFAYAVNILGPGRIGPVNVVIGDATFTNDRAPGVSVTASQSVSGWASPEYGDSDNDDFLEFVMSSIRWDSAPATVDIELDVTPGEQYKLQMLFTESCCNRGFDIYLEEELLEDDFVIYEHHLDPSWGIASREDGVAIVHEFTAGDNVLTLNLGGDAPDFPDNNGHISALTLERLTVQLPGDFNKNGTLDLPDVNMLIAEIDLGTNKAGFDLTNDGMVNSDDLTNWVDVQRKTWFGDANLDGQFNSTDFVQVFQAGEYEDAVADNSGWDEGDWTGDREFDSSDFVAAFQAGGYEKGLRAAVSAVPEPAGLALCVVGAVCMLWRRR